MFPARKPASTTLPNPGPNGRGGGLGSRAIRLSIVIRSMPVEDHYVFRKPDNSDIPIWRYVDFAKYVSFVDSKSLFFPRSDMLDDPYEGTYSQPTWSMLEASIEDAGVESGVDL